MPPIVSPQPRVLACSQSATMQPMPSSIYLAQSHASSPRATLNASRLMSPILLAERPTSFNSKPSSRTALRRRSALNHFQRRRRHCARADCRFDIAAPYFDNLPWISALETSPDRSSGSDIADLSQIPVDPAQSSVSDPIRRRKRSRPLSSEADRITHSRPEPTPFPFHCTTDSFASRPRTPLSLIPPSQIRFHNLMPVVFDSHHDEHPLRRNSYILSPPPSPHHFPPSS